MNAPSNMKYDHLYQTLVAENHPALDLIDRIEEEVVALVDERYGEMAGVSGCDFERWAERKVELEKDARKLWGEFDNIVCADYYGETIEQQSIEDIVRFVKSAIKFIDESRF